MTNTPAFPVVSTVNVTITSFWREVAPPEGTASTHTANEVMAPSIPVVSEFPTSICTTNTAKEDTHEKNSILVFYKTYNLYHEARLV